jgi:hypothetical protein
MNGGSSFAPIATAMLLLAACNKHEDEVDVGPEPQLLATTAVAATAFDQGNMYFAPKNAQDIYRASAGDAPEVFVPGACTVDATVGSIVVAVGTLHWACVTATRSTTWSMPVDGREPHSTSERSERGVLSTSDVSGKIDSLAALRERVFASAYMDAEEKTVLYEIGPPDPVATLDGPLDSGIVVHDRGLFACPHKGPATSVVQIDLTTGTASDFALAPGRTLQSLVVDDEGLLRVEGSGAVRHVVRRTFLDAHEVELATIGTDGPVLVTPSEIFYGVYDEVWRARSDGSGAEPIFSRPKDPKRRVIKWLVADAQGKLTWGAVSTSCNDGSTGLCCCTSWWSDWRVVRSAS